MKRPFVHAMRVRFRDTDVQGHVYFGNYFEFCDEAFSAYMRAMGMPWQEMVKSGSLGTLKLIRGSFGFHLNNARGFNTKHSDGNDALVISPHLCHADLFADDRFLCHGGSPFSCSSFTQMLRAASRRSTSIRFCREVPISGRTRTSVTD